ncbi:tetratricopeptide repeat protein 4 isoform X2 [Thalassophryne amazonica]|uniref:tetratricopeptide repeat protein 4 isoform X2 n=1 Tax=Thalassophryne amazonica TaxID=390379 RepID=UPI001471AF66|nr:tetratricopeptide repeat protein 4 isoform X2 [Thalassophryne amazonica]
MNQQDDSDDGMDEFYDKFKTQRYRKGFNENNWEEEFDKVPMFMKTAPEDIDPNKYPELACLQAVIHNEDRPPEEQAKSLKDEGNAFFKEKNYQKSILSYTAALKKQCGDQDLNTVLLTNRAAAHFHIGNMRSALNDAAAAKKIKPDHLKALIRGAQCCIKLRLFAEAVQWCDEGLKFHPSDRKLQELRAAADQQKRAADRDARKAKAKEKKLHGEKEALLAAIKERGIKLHQPVKAPQPNSDSEDEGSSAALAQLKLDGLSSQEATGAQVFMDTHGSLHWPVLFLYPEHQQSDFISAFFFWTTWLSCLEKNFLPGTQRENIFHQTCSCSLKTVRRIHSTRWNQKSHFWKFCSIKGFLSEQALPVSLCWSTTRHSGNSF